MTPSLVPPNTRYFESFNESHREWAGAYQDGDSLWLAADLGLDLSRPDDFDVWVETLLVEADASYPVPEGRVTATTLWIVEDGNYLGAVNLRHYLDDFLREVGGHIGYGIRPSARRRGLARMALDAALARAARLGLDRVLVTCGVDNRAPAARSRPLGAYSKTSDHPPSPIVSRDSIWSCASLLDRHTALTPARSG